MNYTIDPINDTIANIHADSNIDDLFSTLPNVKTFIFEDGNFYITRVLHITKNYVTLKSKNLNASLVHIIQSNIEMDGISIRNCIGVKITAISIHVPYPGKVALTVAGVKKSIISLNNIYGNTNTFTVYYAGPTIISEGQSTLDAYNNYDLDADNIFKKNVIYSKWSGDSVAFCLQIRGFFVNNIIRGGKLAVYMCRNANIEHNTIYDSVTNGIYISLPSNNLIVRENKISECTDSAIKIANQMEHGEFTSSNYNILLLSNKIYDSQFYSIEINNAIDTTILGNHFIGTNHYGIYSYNSNQLLISNNITTYFTVGIWLEHCSDVTITNNNFNSVYPEICENLLKCVTSTNVIFVSNNIKGMTGDTLYSVDSTSNSVTIENNTINNFYTFEEELRIMKF